MIFLMREILMFLAYSGDVGTQLRYFDVDIKDDIVSLDSNDDASNHTVDKNITVLNFY